MLIGLVSEGSGRLEWEIVTDWYTDTNEFAFLQRRTDGVNSVAECDANAHCDENPED